MQKHVQELYVREVGNQAELALRATKALEWVKARLDDKSKEWKERQPYQLSVFKEIYSFLTHASNISKLFYPAISVTPPSKADKLQKWQRTNDRGQFLRQLYHIQSPNVFESRYLRNHLEHFDERLDDFYEERENSTTGKGMTDLSVGDIKNMYGGIRPDFILRHYDHSTEFIFRGVSYQLKPIAEAVGDV